ncbi:LacI family DNA-binding transcriptional regulator [Xylanimonas protaetiae]|uniref:LacI family transcriptional regulator n=1 Tax=Xylanimonas protaetiae TaxID=2509457 RepID=A0A4P6F7E3_9MICO|nr:LacI family DNA-binding transcriptional regulator [Xylanimonas protaetiae]QAY70763.1 LacI family transcriptional regulator [Xylanimonas protaetiae]
MGSRRDVAVAAGVSVRTVSNVVSGAAHVAPRTRERVLRAIEQLDYRPSEFARSLRVGRSGLVGLMLPELDTPYFADITRTLVGEGSRHGLTVVIDQTEGDRNRELAWIERTTHGGLFDGLILSPLALRPGDVGLFPRDSPVVFLGEDEFPGFDHVMVDGAAAARDAVTHLVDAGRRRIAVIGAERPGRGTSAQRLDGWRDALARADVPADPELVGYVSGFTRTEGYRAMHELLDRGPDAVFCFSDPLALGAMRALYERKVRVPDDVAVVGFDDIEDGRFSAPSLTTISPDKALLARTTFRRLTARLEGSRDDPETVIVPHRLVVRESSPGD